MSQSVGLAKLGELRGTAVVRDKHGNIKSHFEFGGPATLAEAEAVSDATGVALDVEATPASGENHGSDSNHRRA